MTTVRSGRAASAATARKFFTEAGKPLVAPGSRRSLLSPALFAALLCFPIFGCQHAMSTSNSGSAGRVVRNEFPLRFKEHSFDAVCYNTIGCKVVYSNTVEWEDEHDEVSPPPKSANYRDNWGLASHIGIDNFPPPAEVTWKSLDGTAHEAQVDIGKIFRDELVLHNVPQEDIPVETAAMIGGPSIFLEVNDRTISVYMNAHIALKDTPSRKSDFRSELILVWSHTY